MRSASKFSLPLLRRRAEEESAGLPALMLEAQTAAHSILTGEHAQRKPGGGEKFWQFRDYDPSDRPQDIDWRQSAKGDRIFVRQKEWQTAQTALFWCAADAGMDYRSAATLPSKRETAVTISLALAILLTHAGERIGLLEGGMTAGRSEHALQKIGQHLLDRPADSLPALLPAITRNTALVMTGDFLDMPDHIAATFEPLAARTSNALVIQVLDPAEIDLPFRGRVIFEHPAHHAERHHITNAQSVRAAYKERIDRQIEHVRTICRRHQWHWILHRTDTPVRETLHEIWMMIAPGDTR